MKSTLRVKTSFFPLAFILFFVTPIIEINGNKHSRKWGTSEFELEPGTYKVRVYFKYLWMSECGANSRQVEVADGKAPLVEWSAPWIMTMKGSMKVR